MFCVLVNMKTALVAPDPLLEPGAAAGPGSLCHRVAGRHLGHGAAPSHGIILTFLLSTDGGD